MPGKYNRKDHFYQQAKSEGYRSRAAYKLIELDKKFRFLKPGATVLDLGSFPGGWLQVAAERVGAEGTVIGIDLNELEPISVKQKIVKAPVVFLGDINDPALREQICAASGGEVNVVLSDMSPKLTGVRFGDAARSAELVETALHVARDLLTDGGTFVAKIFPGPEADSLAKVIRATFGRFSRENLDSSRKSSTEYYFVAQEFSKNR
ncbi:MAG: RlmE family RNA methyltransferase [Bdellovibrionota bacterium]